MEVHIMGMISRITDIIWRANLNSTSNLKVQMAQFKYFKNTTIIFLKLLKHAIKKKVVNKFISITNFYTTCYFQDKNN